MALGNPGLGRRAGARDVEAMFRAHFDAVYRVCANRLGDPHEAEDVAQEVFIRAMRYQPDPGRDPLPWLLRTATNLCTDEFRRRAARPYEARYDPVPESEPAPDDPERQVLDRVRLGEMLGCLTKAERRVVSEKWLLDRTHRGTGLTMGISAGTTKQLLSRAKSRLVAYLEEQSDKVRGFVLLPLQNLLRRAREQNRHHADSVAFVGQQFSSLAVQAMVAAALGLSIGAPVAAASLGGQASRITPSVVAGTSPVVATAAPELISAGSARGADLITPALSLTPQVRQQDVGTTDLEASPNYQSDHTVLQAGVVDGCTRPPCDALFESRDGGASWHQLPAVGFASTQLLLPEATFASGHFYALGANGLQVTTDGGRSFSLVPTYVSGYAAASPRWRVGWVSVSNVAVWDLVPSQTSAGVMPMLTSYLPAGYRAAGAPLFDSPAEAMYQPVIDSQQLPTVAQVVRCGSSCGTPVSLPWAGSVTLRASREFSKDHVLAASIANVGLAISSDGGTSYKAVSLPPGRLPVDQRVASVGGSPRLVALLKTVSAPAFGSWFSQDLGKTWTPSRVSGSAAGAVFSAIAELGDGSFIASFHGGSAAAPNGFVCSSDGGASWRSCSSQ